MAPPGGQPQMGEMPQMPSMMPMLLSMLMMFGLYFIDGPDHIIGNLLNYGLGIFAFDGQYPVVTLMIVGALMVTLSTLVRSLKTDMLAQTKSQHIMNAFNQELRQARLDNNTYKMKRLMEIQPQLMNKNMEQSSAMMKLMPYTMLIIIPLFLWVRYFVSVTLMDPASAGTLISVPWAEGVDLNGTLWFMPVWIVVYTLISIPLGQILNRLIRCYKFKKHLVEIERAQSIYDEEL